MHYRIETDRLVLRPFVQTDAPGIERLAGDWQVARNLSAMPHPYPKGAAAEWIESQRAEQQSGREIAFAVCTKPRGTYVGTISVRPRPNEFGTIGYWIGRPYWGRGLATEAVQCVLFLVFEHLRLDQATAIALQRNFSSRRVLGKAGFKEVGKHRRRFRDAAQRQTFLDFRITRAEWQSGRVSRV